MDRSIRDGAPGRAPLRDARTEALCHRGRLALLRVQSAPSGPNSVLRPPPLQAPSVPTGKPAVLGVRLERDGLLVSVPPLSDPPRERVSRAWVWTEPVERAGQVLLRKEVIQPHLPVRLPCYDFVPIADPTFDSSLSCELGHWLRVLPTFVT